MGELGSIINGDWSERRIDSSISVLIEKLCESLQGVENSNACCGCDCGCPILCDAQAVGFIHLTSQSLEDVFRVRAILLYAYLTDVCFRSVGGRFKFRVTRVEFPGYEVVGEELTLGTVDSCLND